MDNVRKIQEVLENVEGDVMKFGNGNKSACFSPGWRKLD